MTDWTPEPEALARRATIRKVVASATVNGWKWSDAGQGWHTPTGLFIDVDTLFRSPDPAAFLAENEDAAYAAVRNAIDVTPTVYEKHTQFLEENTE